MWFYPLNMDKSWYVFFLSYPSPHQPSSGQKLCFMNGQEYEAMGFQVRNYHNIVNWQYLNKK